MDIVIDNRQKLYRINRNTLRTLLAALAVGAQRAVRQPPWRELTVILTDDAGMPFFNRTIMRHNDATDVITQRYEPLPGEPTGLLGELIVNVERAWQAGSDRCGWSPSKELALYLAHGCDHLNGENDASLIGRRRMRRRELRWLRMLWKPTATLLEIT